MFLCACPPPRYFQCYAPDAYSFPNQPSFIILSKISAALYWINGQECFLEFHWLCNGLPCHMWIKVMLCLLLRHFLGLYSRTSPHNFGLFSIPRKFQFWTLQPEPTEFFSHSISWRPIESPTQIIILFFMTSTLFFGFSTSGSK